MASSSSGEGSSTSGAGGRRSEGEQHWDVVPVATITIRASTEALQRPRLADIVLVIARSAANDLKVMGMTPDQVVEAEARDDPKSKRHGVLHATAANKQMLIRDYGLDPNETNVDGDSEIAKHLLSVDHVCQDGEIQLHFAALHGHAEMVKLLLDRYANVAVMDVLAVKQASKFAKDAVANGPIVLEMDTYRYHGHSMSDQGGTYRTRDEISGVRQERDPVERVRKLILAHNLATPELKDMEKEIRKQVDAIAKAKESSMPDTSELFINVYKKDFSVEERDRIERIRKLIYAHDLATPAELKDMEKEIRKQVDDAIAKEKESSMPDTSVLFTNGHQNGCGVEPPAEIDLVERRCRTLMSRRNDIDFMENASYKFYKGPIFNTVTCSLDGSNEEVSYSHLCATGHHRLWHFINGMILDTSSLFGPGRVLYTTAERGTFYLKYTYRNHEVTLPIDGRLGWDFGIQNKFGTFEFAHGCKNMYLDLYDNWKMLQGFPGDYSVKGISPNGLESTPMGITAARYACEILSEYKGELPAPEVVRECCSVLMQYGPEALNFNVVLDKTVPSLSQNGELPSMPMTLNSLSPALAPVERRWSNFGGVGLQTCMWKLKYPHVETEAKLRGIPGVVTTVDQALDAVNVIPYNRIPFPGGRKRTWKAFGLDRDAYLAGGRPHVLSPEFARPWPYNEKLVRNIPDEKFYQGWEEFTVHRIY